MAARVLLQFAKPEMQLARPIWDRDGKLVVGRGSRLNERVVRLLRRMGLQTVVVEDTGGLAAWEKIPGLAHDLEELDARFTRADRSQPLEAVRRAIERHLRRRAAALESDPALAAEAERGTPNGREMEAPS
jgi:hypothetical protein